MPKVMLAEDDVTMLSLLRTLLSMEGFETATLGDDVLDSLRRESPDVVLMDVNLTHGNGIDYLRLIRKDEKLKKMYIIMSSGMPLESECIGAGADSFLMKPYMPDLLITAIKKGLAAGS